ncbi:MAG: hypothetical protein J6A23_10020 [Thermoguttaceae bacterium]|nr:hypothetical protein [Thermoguttaceae bacterium]
MKQILCPQCRGITQKERIVPGETVLCAQCAHPLLKTSEHDLIADVPDCLYCSSAIQDGDVSVYCPECGAEFHHECWLENEGCSTYGCTQTGVLKSAPLKITAEMLEQAAYSADVQRRTFINGIPQPSEPNGPGCFGVLFVSFLFVFLIFGV